MKRGKPLKRLGKKGAARKKARRDAVTYYFQMQGMEVADAGASLARCQVCGEPMERSQAQAHHKVLRSQGGKDTLENLLVCHGTCHTIFLHDGLMGLPTDPEARRRLSWASLDSANAKNGLTVGWDEEDLAAVRVFRGRWRE